MQNKIILIEGYLASGKSTFALRLSKELRIPYFIKDTFKSALCASIPIQDRETSSRFSAVTFDGMMYVMERFFETGFPVIFEGNFVPAGVKKQDEAGIIRGLIDQFAYHSLTYQFTGDTNVLYHRFIQREKTPERGQANIMFSKPSYEVFDKICRNLDGFDVGGETIKVDTTDFQKVDFNKYIEMAKAFLNEGGLQNGSRFDVY